MKFKRILFSLSLIALLSACTSTYLEKIPGKKQKSFPKELQGKYTLEMDGTFGVMMQGVGTTVVISKNSISTQSGEEAANTMTLNDSLFLSKIGKTFYLSMGLEPKVLVMKLQKDAENWQVHPLVETGVLAESDIKSALPSARLEYTEDSSSLSVFGKVSDKEIDKLFKSKLVCSEKIVLKKVK